MDRIQGISPIGGSQVTPAAGSGVMTNHVLGAYMNNNSNNSGFNSNVGAQNSGGAHAPHQANVTGTSNAQNPGGQNNNQAEDISPEGLLLVISQEWNNEMERIKSLGLNGYKRRKESRSECLVQSGHAEIEGESKLFIYGNALEVLNNAEF